MAKTPLLIANWKMNLLPDEACLLVKRALELDLSRNLGLVFATPYPYLPLINSVLQSELHKPGKVGLAAQDISAHKSGAYTGEVSGEMLKAIGTEYVLIGHSERREYHNEDELLIKNKLIRAWEKQIITVLCVGETLELRNKSQHLEYIRNQIYESLVVAIEEFGALPAELVIAYEPIWAIGTGRSASSEEVQEVHGYIRQILLDRYPNLVFSILYGGSVNVDNATKLFSIRDVDGALVGGASLQIESMHGIIRSFVKSFAKA